MKKVAIFNNPFDFEEFVNRQDIEIISIDAKAVESSFQYQQGFMAILIYKEIESTKDSCMEALVNDYISRHRSSFVELDIPTDYKKGLLYKLGISPDILDY